MIKYFKRFNENIAKIFFTSQYNKNNYCLIYFWIAILFYILYKIITMPGLLFEGEIWAESATSFYKDSISNPFLQQLFTTDAGYWSFLQRIIAIIGVCFKIPAGVIPYYYSWTSVIITSFLFAPFCLSYFRNIVSSDLFRFFICITFIILSDFETSTFINFTYYSVFFIIIISISAFKEGKNGKVPWWAWFIPLFIVSKPCVLSVIPIMIIIAFFADKRFKKITVLSVILGVAQGIRLVLSSQESVLSGLQYYNFSTIDKILLGIKKLFEIIPCILFGDIYHSSSSIVSIILGIIILFAFICLIVKFYLKNKNINLHLIITGFLLAFFNVMLLAYSMPAEQNEIIKYIHINRYTIITIWGFLFIIIGVLDTLNTKHKHLALKIYLIYFLIFWLYPGIRFSRERKFPSFHSSKWMQMIQMIENNKNVCVPISPYGWVYQQGNCSVITDYIRGEGIWIEYTPHKNEVYTLTSDLSKININSFVLPIRPKDKKTKFISAKAKLILANNETIEILSNYKIHSSGGTLLFLVPKTDFEIKKVSFEFNDNVEILYITKNPSILWFGEGKERE